MDISIDQLDFVVMKKEEEEDEEVPFPCDGILLQVFKYLPVPELFAARLVCRRWAALALHQDVWRHRVVSDVKKGVLEAALRLAPCLRILIVLNRFCHGAPDASSFTERDARLDVLVTTTRCAVEVLGVYVDDCNAVTAASLLRNQAQLGRLRTLILRFCGVSAPLSGRSRVLVWTVCSTEGLTKLTLQIDCADKFNPDWLPSERPRSSLKTLTCHFSDVSWFPVLQHLLDCHADTLKCLAFKPAVHNGKVELNPHRPCAESVASRVAGLRELHCPLLRGMGALLNCNRLESLVLHIDEGLRTDLAVLREAKKYLRKATQLRKLTFEEWHYLVDTVHFFRMTMDLVEALASSRRSALQILAFGFIQGSKAKAMDGAFLNRLSNALGLLPALRQLYVDVGSADVLVPLLECLSRVASSSDTPLTALTLRVDMPPGFYGIPDWCCGHAWMHRESLKIKEIFKKCPALHVLFTRFFYCHFFFRQACPACLLHCHKPVATSMVDDYDHVLLFGHPKDGQCDGPQHAHPRVTCHRVGGSED